MSHSEVIQGVDGGAQDQDLIMAGWNSRPKSLIENLESGSSYYISYTVCTRLYNMFNLA